MIRLLAGAMSLAATGSYLGFDVIDSNTLTSPLTQGLIKMLADSGAPWIGTMDDPKSFMAERGWKAKVTNLGSPEASYNRWPYPAVPEAMPGMPHHWLVTGGKE